MHLYSNKLSLIATISSLIMSEFLPACFSSSNKPNMSQKLFGSVGKNLVLEIPEAETIILGDLSIYIGVRS